MSLKDEKLLSNLLDKVFSIYLKEDKGQSTLYLKTLVDKTHALNPHINRYAKNNLLEISEMSTSTDFLSSETFINTISYTNTKYEKCEVNINKLNQAILKHNKLVKMPGKTELLKAKNKCIEERSFNTPSPTNLYVTPLFNTSFNTNNLRQSCLEGSPMYLYTK
jgi:hypothetical protein